MSYPFIDLDKSKKDELITHLITHCGIEKKATESKDELINAILEFEENNGLVRSAELMPKTLATNTKEPDPVLHFSDDLNDYPKVTIVIASSDKFDGNEDVLVWLNGRSFQMQRDQEVTVPQSVYQLLLDAKSKVVDQKTDGTLIERIVPNYSIQLLG